jgi:hypothetical protein
MAEALGLHRGGRRRHASAMQEIIDHELRATSMMGGSMSGSHCFR